MNDRLHVLVVEDNRADADLIREALPETGPLSFDVESVPRLSDALARLKRGGLDLIIIDLGLPDSQGLDTFNRLREADPDTPMIVVTGNNDMELAISAVREGAQDFIIKGQFGSGVLVRAARYAVERTSALEEIRQREQELMAIYENAPIVMLLVNAERRIFKINEIGAAFSGRPVAEAVGAPVGEALRCLNAFDDPQGCGYGPRCESCLVRTTIEKTLETGASHQNVEVTVPYSVSQVERERHFLLSTSPLTVRKRLLVLVSLLDITARKQADNDLHASEARYRRLFESAKDGILILDAETGLVVDVNPFFCELLGYPGEQLRGKAIWELGFIKDVVASQESFKELQIQEYIRYEDLPMETATGQRIEVEFVSTIYLVDGRKVIQCNIRDITEQRRLAQEQVKLQDQLRQAQKVEAIGQLAGGVAHDFNNMMAIILGYGEMLLGQLTPEDPARKWAQQIVEAGRRSAALTRQLLAFSRKQTLAPEVLELNALVRNLEKMLARLIGENIELEFKLAGDLARIKADPGQIEQVITNLVLNARDAMLLGGRLTIETANVELDPLYALGHESVLPGCYVLLAVTDTGCGMDKATMARLFEPFFTTKEQGRGTGLGLATAYGIVKQSGGHIWAYSEPDQGTTFKIYLPQTDAALATNVVEAKTEAPRGSGERILLVEDEASLRELCETVLVRLGYRVDAAGNGLKALLMVQEQGLEPDLVITDVVMPAMSGPEMARRLRRDRPDIRVLYMSGHPDDTIARHGISEQGMPFLQKPFAERNLAVKVREALEKKPAVARLGRSVLMIDDDEQFRELVRHFCVKRGHVFAGAGDAAAALTALAKQSFDVLLVDKNIPGTSGEHILREIRAAGHTEPAIVLTGDVASADMDSLRPLGVVRALEKSSNAEPLLRAIEEQDLA